MNIFWLVLNSFRTDVALSDFVYSSSILSCVSSSIRVVLVVLRLDLSISEDWTACKCKPFCLPTLSENFVKTYSNCLRSQSLIAVVWFSGEETICSFQTIHTCLAFCSAVFIFLCFCIYLFPFVPLVFIDKQLLLKPLLPFWSSFIGHICNLMRYEWRNTKKNILQHAYENKSEKWVYVRSYDHGKPPNDF